MRFLLVVYMKPICTFSLHAFCMLHTQRYPSYFIGNCFLTWNKFLFVLLWSLGNLIYKKLINWCKLFHGEETSVMKWEVVPRYTHTYPVWCVKKTQLSPFQVLRPCTKSTSLHFQHNVGDPTQSTSPRFNQFNSCSPSLTVPSHTHYALLLCMQCTQFYPKSL